MKSLFSWVKRLSKIFEKRPLRILLLLSFFICILSAAIPIGFLLPEIRLEGSIPLHYNIYFGVDWYGAWWNIFFMPIIGAVILLVNTVITMIYGVKDAVLIHMLWVNTLLCEFILLIAIIFTTLLNLTYI